MSYKSIGPATLSGLLYVDNGKLILETVTDKFDIWMADMGFYDANGHKWTVLQPTDDADDFFITDWKERHESVPQFSKAWRVTIDGTFAWIWEKPTGEKYIDYSPSVLGHD